jgi:hypothetical protein
MTRYKPNSATYPTSRMPMLQYWNAVEPTIYLTLFELLAPLKESRDILQIFSDKADAAYAHPTYLAYVVLAPVHKISGHLLDMCAMERIVDEKSPPIRHYKLRHQVTAYVAKQYIAALIAESGKTIDSKEDRKLTGDNIAKLGGITKILLNLPREFQRWNKNYSTVETRKSRRILDATEQPPYEKTQPFNVTERLHPSFRKCVQDDSETGYKILALNESWDIETVSQGLLTGEYDITLNDFNKDPIQTYKMGELPITKPRGDTVTPSARITSKRKNQDDDDQEGPAKVQKTGEDEEESDEDEEENEGGSDDDDTEGAINKIICRNLQTKASTKLKNNQALLVIVNAISLDLVEHLTKIRPTEGKIKRSDYVNKTNRKTKKTD